MEPGFLRSDLGGFTVDSFAEMSGVTGTVRPMTTTASSAPAYGEVFTLRWVVDLILDLCEYTPDRDLTGVRIAEPSVGGGAFLLPVLERLLLSRSRHQPDQPWEDLAGVIRGWDLQPQHVETCRELTARALVDAGCPAEIAHVLAATWLHADDFLLAPTHWEFEADLVVGNPPYIRIEDIEPGLLAAYRAVCPAMGGRADIFIGFFEHAMDMLATEGRVAFICADRWMRNQYGVGLRQKIVDGGFAVDLVLTMHDAKAFADEVSAYPAIAVIRAGAEGRPVVGNAGAGFGVDEAARFAAWAAGDTDVLLSDHVTGHRLAGWHRTADSWAEGSPDLAAWLADIQGRFEPLENPATGTKVGIGVATGRDAVFIVKHDKAPRVEASRLLPLSMAADLRSGSFEWGGNVLVNPWGSDGLVSLADYPQLARYYEDHEAVLRGRNVAKRAEKWWRTIDRVNLDLLDRPMLVMADMKDRADPVLVPKGYYPHHNLYWVISDAWDLEVLGGLLLSKVVERQVAAYCVKMRGGTLRFQAQYLRRIHLPSPQSIGKHLEDRLRRAFRDRDRAGATSTALDAYGISHIPD